MTHISMIVILFSVVLIGCQSTASKNIILNDIHSRLNATAVEEVYFPQSTDEIVTIINRAKINHKSISISGGKHSMGGQQFGKGTLHISMSKLNDVLAFDSDKGIVRVEAGIEWPKIIEYLQEAQKGKAKQWSIVQKQTGADNLSMGGALSSNIHGRGVRFRPMIQDVEAFTLVNAEGKVLNVSREENSELFQLVIGGYGLFGVIATVDLRLQPRVKLQRFVEVISIDELPEKAKQRLADGFMYGDFQYKTDEKAADFMRVGVFSTYKPVPMDTPIPEVQKRLDPEKWNELTLLAHVDKSKAFEMYSKYYLTTNGQIYWSDAHQFSFYNKTYVEYLNKKVPDLSEGSLMITEVYVPRENINDFIRSVIDDMPEYQFNIVYGTMRLIEKDTESFLAWAKQNYACVIFNLRVEHSEQGMEKAQRDFQRLIDRALELDGSYYLTYHRWARKDQILKAYPQFVDFLRMKLKHDPQERFQSEWYRHYKKMFAEELK